MNKRLLLFTGLFFVIDLITKSVIEYSLKLSESIVIFKSFFSLTKVHNTGASFGFLSGNNLLLIIIGIIVLLMIITIQKDFIINIRNILAFSMIYAGILGNILNRIIYGYVIDMFDFKMFGYNYPVFNFADVFIVLGIILLMIAIIKKEDSNESSS